MKVIEVTCTKGEGTPDDLMRIIKMYWSEDGELLAVYDPEKDSFAAY